MTKRDKIKIDKIVGVLLACQERLSDGYWFYCGSDRSDGVEETLKEIATFILEIGRASCRERV